MRTEHVSDNTKTTEKYEDAVMKMTAKYFAKELLPYFGVEGKVKRVAPTEEVYLELKGFLQDMNFDMEDGTRKHLEFSSKNGGKKDLKRFRAYEAVSSYQDGVPVTTYVIFSGKTRAPMYEYTEGINTYRVVPLVMQDRNADAELKNLLDKIENEKILQKSDLVSLALCPLMAGDMEIKDRIITAFSILKKVPDYPEETGKVEAVLYAMAEKFLEEEELKEVKREVKMTRLGQMLVADGISQGISQGVVQGMIETLKELGETFENTKKKVIEKYPDRAEKADEYMRLYWKD